MRSFLSRAMWSVGLMAVLAAPSLLAQAARGHEVPAYTQADADFMTGMIGHHAQAVLIAGWVPTHGASSSVAIMSERIVVGQQDEIALMETWLRDRELPVPQQHGEHMMMPGMDHAMHMPGMLSAAQLDSLDRARGPEFDRLFLQYMIQHHLGAIAMVNELFATPGAGQDEATFRLASDIYADQTTEIGRMRKMLDALSPADGQ